MRKWGENEEVEKDSVSTFPHFLFISFLSIISYFSFCRKMLNMALLSRITQKTYHTRYENIILGRIRWEKAPQVVRAYIYINAFND